MTARGMLDDFQRLCFAYLVDIHGGQVVIPVRELNYAGMYIRFELSPVEETVTLTLKTTESPQGGEGYIDAGIDLL